MSKPDFRQAVLVIHGIGEQRPMSTIRSFVTALVRDAFRNKPDDLSRLFELRRLVHESNVGGKTYQTCFFEYYWAYRLRDTSYRHVADWGRRLLGTRWGNVPRRLRWVWLLCYATLFMLLVALISLVPLGLRVSGRTGTLADKVEGLSGVVSLASVAATVILALVSGVLLRVIGDAARYLNSAPSNVAERQAIRTDGLELLHRLHDEQVDGRPKYDRIIIVGHSLGSVIGYDIMKFYWVDVHERVLIKSGSAAAEQLGQLTEAGKKAVGVGSRQSRDAHQQAQKAYQEAQGALIRALPPDSPWRITDFVTLGSPLTHADFLLAESEGELQLRQMQRELPTCPPQEDEETHRYSFERRDETGAVVGEVLHHAAHFALTRWTNIYFPGDLIGGKVGRLFGDAIVDCECDFPADRSRSRSRRSHTQYWRDRHPEPSSVGMLREIILPAQDNLPSSSPLARTDESLAATWFGLLRRT